MENNFKAQVKGVGKWKWKDERSIVVWKKKGVLVVGLLIWFFFVSISKHIICWGGESFNSSCFQSVMFACWWSTVDCLPFYEVTVKLQGFALMKVSLNDRPALTLGLTKLGHVSSFFVQFISKQRWQNSYLLRSSYLLQITWGNMMLQTAAK